MDELLYVNEELRMLIHDHPAATVLLFVLAGLFGEFIYSRFWGGKPMNPKHDRYIHECLADILTDGLEAYKEFGLLTQEDVDLLYKQAGNHLKAYQLLPRRSLSIPQEIRRRLWNMWRKNARTTASEMKAIIKPKRTEAFK